MPAAPENTDHPGASRISRRDFVKIGVAAGVSLPGAWAATQEGTGPPHALFAAPPLEKVRIGFVGVGNQGTSHVRNLARIEGVEIKAVCDIIEDRVIRAQTIVREAGQPCPAGYARGDHDFLRMCEEMELDIVYTATPWEWHAPVCVAAMETGKHAATEVPACVTIEECWQLVETAERHRKHCVMMENCCYGRAEMIILNMARQGVLGEIIHGECGYLHDLRALFTGVAPGREWFGAHIQKRNGSLYTTHGLGPVAQCMDINRGDRLTHLVSMSSAARGVNLYAREHFPESDPRRAVTYLSGDVNTTLVHTERGRTITIVYNCNNPRPYSRINMVQGTAGIACGYPDRVFIEGKSPGHDWEPLENYAAHYEPTLWKDHGADAASSGHGGMDFLEDLRLIHCLRAGAPLDMDVYDAAAWSAIAGVSEQSVANRSAVVDIPDFTRGAWRERPQLAVPGEA